MNGRTEAKQPMFTLERRVETIYIDLLRVKIPLMTMAFMKFSKDIKI